MDDNKSDCTLSSCARSFSFILMVIGSPISQGATLWTGPNINFTQSASARSDTILTGKVVLTRGNNQVLFNTAAGEGAAGPASPADTEWAFGALSNFSTLSYQSLESMRNGNLAGSILNQPMVMHLINEDIYLSVTFTAWGQHFTGGFAYTRSTPAVAVQPTATITKPATGSVFAAPANVTIAANATVSGGTVTNVSFFSGSILLGSLQSPPFTLTASNLTAGSYALTVIAVASGIATTSSVVAITVVSPVLVSLTSPAARNGLFSFSYSVQPGLSYVVQRSSNLLDWVSVVTNVASSNPVPFSESLNNSAPRYYRVGRMPGP